jgi:hypothetical protein
MAISVTNLGTAFSPGPTSSVTLTLSAAVPAGSLIVLETSTRVPSGTDSLADSSSNSYSTAVSAFMANLNTNGKTKIWYVPNASALSSGNTIVYTIGGSDRATIGAIYATGIATSSPLDVTSSSTGTGTSASAVSPTPTVSGGLVIALSGWASGTSAVTADTTNGWTNIPGAVTTSLAGSTNTVGEYWVNSGVATKTFATTCAASTAYAVLFAVFKPSVVAASYKNFFSLF